MQKHEISNFETIWNLRKFVSKQVGLVPGSPAQDGIYLITSSYLKYLALMRSVEVIPEVIRSGLYVQIVE